MRGRKKTQRKTTSVSKRLAAIVAIVLLGVFAVMTVAISVFVGGSMLKATDKTMFAMADNGSSKMEQIVKVANDIDDNIQTVMKRMYAAEDNVESGIAPSWTVEGEVHGQPEPTTGTFISRVTGEEISGSRYAAETVVINSMIHAITTYENIVDVGLLMEPGAFSKDMKQFAPYISREDNEKGVVIVIGSGLSDGGVLNFADNDILDRDIDSLMEELTDENNRALPKNLLKNTTVVWNGLGEVAFPQLELTPSQNESLREIYENVLGKNGLGAKKVIWKDSTDYTQSIKTNKTVKVTKTEMESGNSGREITLSIDFKENSASIKDISKAESDLAGIISELKKYKSKTIYLEGYVGLAKCGDQPDNKLATKRAEAVKDLLIENGISESRIRAEGKGKGPNNECEGGKYDEKVSDKNKFVKLIYKD